MDPWILVGLIAGSFTTFGFVPQIVKGLRTKRMQDVSLTMPIILAVGMFLWIFYGMILQDIPIVLWNAVAFALNVSLIGLKLRYGKRTSCG